MPQYFSPGVYVEEVDSGPRPIQGVSTSVTGAVGVTLRGPSKGKPVLVTSFNEFRHTFGGFHPEPPANVAGDWENRGHWWRFAHAVRGFFDNGGQQLYVKRVVSGGATAANHTFVQGLFSSIVQDAEADSKKLVLQHAVGVLTDDTTTITVMNGQNGEVLAQNVTVAAVNTGTTESTIELQAAVGKPVKASRGDYVVVHPSTADSRLKVSASSEGEWGKSLRVRIHPVSTTFSIQHNPNLDPGLAEGEMSADATNAGTTWTITLDAGHGLQDGDTVQVLGRKYVLLVNADANKFNVERDAADTTAWPKNTRVTKLRKANDVSADPNLDSSKQLFVAGAGALYPEAMVELDDGTRKVFRIVKQVQGSVVSLDTAPGGDDANVDNRITFVEQDKLRLIEAAIDVEYAPEGQVVESESFQNLKLKSSDAADPRLITNHVNRRSRLISVTNVALSNSRLAEFPGGVSAAFQGLDQDGDNGYTGSKKLSVTDFVGVDEGSGKRSGIKAFEDIEDISIVIAPGMWATTIVAELLRHCEAMRYRMAVLDAPANATIQEVQDFRNGFDSKYAALYYPWVTVRQPGVEDNVVSPPSGHIVGIYADVDSRRGVHKAPANEVIKSIIGINQDITRREQDLLNPKGINALRFFPGRGNRVWGARTISSDSNFRYVNVRRIFNFVEASIDRGTQFVVFEPNDDTLWARVRQTIGNFLNTQWRAGVLEGATASEAYFVECDRGVTMTQDDIENGRLIVEVGIAPVFPAEFVIFRIQKFTAESKLS